MVAPAVGAAAGIPAPQPPAGAASASASAPPRHRDGSESVRVAVRLRPCRLADDERLCVTALPEQQGVYVQDPGPNRNGRVFTFDAVYSPEDGPNTDEKIYDESVRSLVDAFLEGYNATVMAYGQTGSGKTYTMQRLTARVLEEIFARVDGRSGGEDGTGLRGASDESGGDAGQAASPSPVAAGMSGAEAPVAWDAAMASPSTSPSPRVDGGRGREAPPTTVSVSHLEVYNEEVRDLLQHVPPAAAGDGGHHANDTMATPHHHHQRTPSGARGRVSVSRSGARGGGGNSRARSAAGRRDPPATHLERSRSTPALTRLRGNGADGGDAAGSTSPPSSAGPGTGRRLRNAIAVGGGAGEALHVMEGPDGAIHVAGMLCEDVLTADQALAVFARSSRARTTAGTQMNAQSSRSHSLFTVYISRPSPTHPHLVHHAKLHLVDLAGSERNKRTGNTGSRLKESVGINTGLLCLGNVITALSRRPGGGHVPYRGSKLTRLLQDSLGGDSKTLFISCITPSAANHDECLSTLGYATRARHIHNQPAPPRAVLAALRSQQEAFHFGHNKKAKESYEREQAVAAAAAAAAALAHPSSSTTPPQPAAAAAAGVPDGDAETAAFYQLQYVAAVGEVEPFGGHAFHAHAGGGGVAPGVPSGLALAAVAATPSPQGTFPPLPGTGDPLSVPPTAARPADDHGSATPCGAVGVHGLSATAAARRTWLAGTTLACPACGHCGGGAEFTGVPGAKRGVGGDALTPVVAAGGDAHGPPPAGGAPSVPPMRPPAAEGAATAATDDAEKRALRARIVELEELLEADEAIFAEYLTECRSLRRQLRTTGGTPATAPASGSASTSTGPPKRQQRGTGGRSSAAPQQQPHGTAPGAIPPPDLQGAPAAAPAAGRGTRPSPPHETSMPPPAADVNTAVNARRSGGRPDVDAFTACGYFDDARDGRGGHDPAGTAGVAMHRCEDVSHADAVRVDITDSHDHDHADDITSALTACDSSGYPPVRVPLDWAATSPTGGARMPQQQQQQHAPGASGTGSRRRGRYDALLGDDDDVSSPWVRESTAADTEPEPTRRIVLPQTAAAGAACGPQTRAALRYHPAGEEEEDSTTASTGSAVSAGRGGGGYHTAERRGQLRQRQQQQHQAADEAAAAATAELLLEGSGGDGARGVHANPLSAVAAAAAAAAAADDSLLFGSERSLRGYSIAVPITPSQMTPAPLVHTASARPVLQHPFAPRHTAPPSRHVLQDVTHTQQQLLQPQQQPTPVRLEKTPAAPPPAVYLNPQEVQEELLQDVRGGYDAGGAGGGVRDGSAPARPTRDPNLHRMLQAAAQDAARLAEGCAELQGRRQHLHPASPPTSDTARTPLQPSSVVVNRETSELRRATLEEIIEKQRVRRRAAQHA